ncbi:MAG: hypothetical protein ABJG78_08730 [Cyclobacteriaceae bacterium]
MIQSIRWKLLCIMSKPVYVVDREGDLRENIVELLNLEGYSAQPVLPEDIESLSTQDNPLSVVLCNFTSIGDQPEKFINDAVLDPNGSLKLVALGDDEDNPAVYKADAFVPLPFSKQELIQPIFDFFSKAQNT